MNVFALFERRVAEALERQVAAGRLPEGLDLSRVVVEPPREASHGDLATNAAMSVAKAARMPPRAIAEMLAEDLRQDPRVTEVAVAGPGFINLRLAPEVHHAVIRAALHDPGGFGRGSAGAGEPVNVEYVSANPTGPMHVGHGRGAVFGDALASLLAFAGREVTREYYINDAGAQVDVLARSAHLRYRAALGDEIGEIPAGLYPGDYLVEVGEALKAEFGDALADAPEAEWLPQVRDRSIDAMMALIRSDLAALGIQFDVFFSERSLAADPDQIGATIADLRVRNLVYEGRLAPPKGQPVEDWEDREQTLFRATEFGDDVDRPLLKSDGAYTYFAADIAYHRSKFERGFAEMIDVWGADHGGYVKRMSAAVKAISAGKATLDVKLCQLVRLLRNGEPVKMSKRSGDFVTLREVVDEVGSDPVRFMMLFRKNDATLDFDLAKVVEQSKDNPVFYVQYAHARAASVFRQAAESLGHAPDTAALVEADLALLADESEIELQRRIGQYPRVIEAAAAAHEPHRVAFYLYDLASLFHALWNKGKDLPQLRFVKQGDESSTVGEARARRCAEGRAGVRSRHLGGQGARGDALAHLLRRRGVKAVRSTWAGGGATEQMSRLTMSEARHQRFEIDIDEIERQLRQSADLAPPAKADPLAELARIVGQNDPFRGILGERRGTEPQAAVPDRAANVHVLARPAAEPPAHYAEPAPAFERQGEAQAQPRDDGYDPVASVYGDPDAAYPEEDMQPLRPRRSRGRLLAVLGGLVVTSAAVGGGLYWQKTGGRIAFSGAPPVITADKSPLKVAPADPGGVEVPNQNKQIYDRKATEGQSRVVDTREQPVDVREVARTLPTTAPDAPTGRSGPSAAPAPENRVSSVLGEPRRVRTVAVRPDGSIYAPPGGQPTVSDASLSLMPGSPPPPVPVATVSVPGRGGAETPAAPTPAPSAMLVQPPAPEASGELGPSVQVLPPRRPKFAALTTSEPTSDASPADAKPAEDKGKFVVQVAVRDTETDARGAWNGLMEKYPGDLEGRRAQVNKAEVKGKTVYRVRVGPLAKAEADALCGKLKSSGGTCFVAAGAK